MIGNLNKLLVILLSTPGSVKNPGGRQHKQNCGNMDLSGYIKNQSGKEKFYPIIPD